LRLRRAVADGVVWPGQTMQTDNFLYHNEGNANRWLKVRLQGTVSNRAPIGAKARVLASLSGTARWQLRELGVGRSGSGADLLPHFGLRDAEKADVVRIEWPSGIVQELRDVRANQTLSVTEPPRLEALGAGRIGIHCWKRQKFETEASNDLLTWTYLGVAMNETGTLEVTDPDATNQPHRFYRAKSLQARLLLIRTPRSRTRWRSAALAITATTSSDWQLEGGNVVGARRRGGASSCPATGSQAQALGGSRGALRSGPPRSYRSSRSMLTGVFWV